MLRSSFFIALRDALAPRAKSALIALAAVFAASTPLSAYGCEIRVGAELSRAKAHTPLDLPETLVPAMLKCGKEARPVLIWTLKIDPSAAHLGVRDAPLFQTSIVGPLHQLAEAEIPGAARVAVHVRASAAKTILASGARAPSYRRFATFCDNVMGSGGAGAPLDCSLNGARIKARATARDDDQDGVLDVVNHEVSLYLGGDRLHVVYFSESYRDSALAGAAAWIDVLSSFGALPPGV